MAFDRRSFLKAMVASSVFSLGDNTLMRAIAASHTQAESYLLLQGLFFLEFDVDCLIVATPEHDPHLFFVRDHGSGSLIEMPRDPQYDDIDDGETCSLPPEVPQFPYDAINQNQGFLKDARSYRCRMILPCPKAIYPLRKGPTSDFLPDTGTQVGGKLVSDKDHIATVICLAYDPLPGALPWTKSYYAEHPSLPVHTKDVNEALASAKKLCGDGFDLQFCDPGTVLPVPTDADADLPDPRRIDHTDEYSIPELLHIRPPQSKSSGKIPPFTRDSLKEHSKAVPMKGKSTSCVRLAGDVSSCPSFGIR